MANRNAQFLSAIDGKAKALILESIAAHYGINAQEAYAEVTDADGAKHWVALASSPNDHQSK